MPIHDVGNTSEHLPDILDLTSVSPASERAGDGAVFRGRPPNDAIMPVYGGHLAAQALNAAGRTVPAGLLVNSLHSYFLRPGYPGIPIDYRVDSLTQSGAFGNRRVTALQDGREVFTLTASFHRPEPGPAYQEPMPDVPGPESLPTHEERMSKALGEPFGPLGKPYDLRYVGPLSIETADDPSLRSPRVQVWVRLAGELPGERSPEPDPLLHACLLTYLSDATLIEPVLAVHGLSWLTDVARGASLDHAVWFHRPLRADGWLLYTQETNATFGARGLASGRFFTRDGELAATVAQEVLVRLKSPQGATTSASTH